MHNFLAQHLFEIYASSIIVFSSVVILFRRYAFSIFDPIFQLIWSISSTLVILFFLTPVTNESEYWRTIFIGLYFLSLVSLTLFGGIGHRDELNIEIVEDEAKLIRLISFSLAMVSGITIAINLQGDFENRNVLLTGPVWVFAKTIFYTSSSLFAVSVANKQDKKITYVLLGIVGCIFALTGSKAFLISTAGIFIMSGAYFNFFRLKLRYIFLLFSLMAVSLKIFDYKLESVIIRPLFTADTYYFLLEEIGIEKLFGAYNFFSYLIHPITNVFGFRGYSHALGAEIQGLLSGILDGSGPNASLFALVAVGHESFLVSLLIAAFWICILILSRCRLMETKRYFSISGVTKLYLLTTFPVLLFFDVGVAMQAILGTVCIWLVCKTAFKIALKL